jgi:hypothetical protein
LIPRRIPASSIHPRFIRNIPLSVHALGPVYTPRLHS